MYRIEIELADGSVQFFDKHGHKGDLDLDSADLIAQRLWELYGESGRFARFSVVDDSGERLTDWEC